MDFLSWLRAFLGKGLVRIELVLDTPRCRQGGTVGGKIYLTGVSAAFIDRVYLEFGEEWQRGPDEGKGHHRRRSVLDSKEVASRLSLQKEEKLTLPFEYRLPLDIGITHYHHQFFFFTRASIPRAPDVFTQVGLEILPALDVQAVQEAIAWKLGFNVAALETKTGFQVFRFRPGPLTPREYGPVEQIEMIFQHESAALKIQMGVKVAVLPGISADNYFTLTLQAKDIYFPDGAVNYHYIAAQFAERLNAALLPVGKSAG